VFVDVYEMAIIVKSNVVSKQEKNGFLRPLMICLSLHVGVMCICCCSLQILTFNLRLFITSRIMHLHKMTLWREIKLPHSNEYLCFEPE